MNPYEILLAAIHRLAAEFPRVTTRCYPLRGSCDGDDQIILERESDAGARTVRIPASSEPVRAFYWGHHVDPGNKIVRWQGEGNLFGTLEYVLYFVRRFIFELDDRDQIPMPNLDGSAPLIERERPSKQ